VKKALLVGIDEYPRADQVLRGCTRDALRMKAALVARYGFEETEARTLLGPAATRAAIERELAWLVGGTSAGDVCVFHYAGHGGQVKDRSGDEEDGSDECLLPIDYGAAGMLSDDDLAVFYRRVVPGANLTLVMDCCHAGTIQKFPNVRCAALSPEEQRAIAEARRRYKADQDAATREVLVHHKGASLGDVKRWKDQAVADFQAARAPLGDVSSRENNLLVAACEPGATSAEAAFGGQYSGCLTHFLLDAMEQLGPLASAKDVVLRAAGSLRAARFSQIPQLEGKDEHKARPLFAPLI
jgi:hypothetical protein